MAQPALVSIVIPAFNQLTYCQQCVASVIANTRPPFRLILVDNASTDGVAQFFDSITGAVVVHAETNLGFAGGVNLGLAHAEGHVVLLNSDTIVPPNWFDPLESAIESAEDIGLAGPMSNWVSGPQMIPGLAFASDQEMYAYARERSERRHGQRLHVARLVGFCLMIRDKTFQDLGLLDELYGIGNFEDDDYCMRAMTAGYRLCIAEDAFVYHYGNRTFVNMEITGEKWLALMADNERKFIDKWITTLARIPDPRQQSFHLNLLAKNAIARANCDQALRILKHAIEACPSLAVNFHDMGILFRQNGDNEKAAACLKQAANLDAGS